MRPATLGETLEPLAVATAGLWYRGDLRVKLASGLLHSVEDSDVLNGANVAALRFGDEGDWEVIQFAKATLIDSDEYLLTGVLRGQAGTDGIMRGPVPAGARFVLLDGAPVQIEHPISSRGLLRHYRVGPGTRPYDDESFEHLSLSFAGVGLRPLRPAHLRVWFDPDGGCRIAWIRRTRIDGDSWTGTEVPLGEEREAYHIRILREDRVVREFESAASTQRYSPEDRAVDGTTESFHVQVAQISDRFGPGPYENLNFIKIN